LLAKFSFELGDRKNGVVRRQRDNLKLLVGTANAFDLLKIIELIGRNAALENQARAVQQVYRLGIMDVEPKSVPLSNIDSFTRLPGSPGLPPIRIKRLPAP